MKEVKRSINSVQIVGTLLEMNLEEITKEVSLKGTNGVEKKVQCKQIAKKEFRNPTFLISVEKKDEDGNVVGSNEVGVSFFPISEKKLDENGNIIDNPRFKAFKTVLETYKPKSACKSDEVPTRVQVDGSLVANEYADKQTFEWKSFPSVNGFNITSTNVSSEDIADCEISGVIESIINETVGEDAKETGRLKVKLWSFDGSGAITPCTFVVEEDLADDFKSYYEIGQSVKIYYEIVSRQIGTKKVSSGGFGRRDTKAVSGFTVTEYSVFRGDDPFEEENEYYVEPSQVKEAMDVREIMIANKTKEAKENKGTSSAPKTSPKGASASASSNPFGGSSTTTKKANPFG